MIAPLLDAIRGEVSGERALDDVRAIAQFHRVQSSPGYDQAAAWMAEALETAGLRPELERVPGDGRTRLLGQLMPEGWSCARAQARLVDANGARPLCDAEREPLSVVLRSAPARGRFPLVVADAPDADGPRLEGLVALTSAPARIAFERLVLGRGAAGLLCDGRRLVAPVRTERDERDALAYTSFWWSGDEPRGWGFVVTPDTGDDLRRRLAEGARLELDVELESRRFATEIPLVSARLGPDGEDREVLVLAHLCHPQPSANDNASGAAATLETARALAALIGRGALPGSRRGIRFLWMPELSGSCAWLGRDPSRAERIVAALNLDMVGEDQHACGSTFLLERPPWFAASFAEDLLGAVRFAAQDWVPSYSGPGHFGMSRMAEVPYGGGSDHAVLLDPTVGVPCPMLIQWPDRFYHSSHDTPDRCDPRSLELAARCAATYAAFLASAGTVEVEWLGHRVARAARVRLLRAMDHGEPRGVERERRRGALALGSLARLGMDPRTIAEEVRRFESFATMEGGGEEARVPGSVPDAGTVWLRDAGPLDFLKHLSAGWERLTPGERQAWRDLEAAHADPLFDVAWMATDGRRAFGDVVRATWLETGRWEPEALARFFAWAQRTGRAAPGTSTPHGRQA